MNSYVCLDPLLKLTPSCSSLPLGVVVSYSVKIKLQLSGMGGELETDLPFKLVHPRPSITKKIIFHNALNIFCIDSDAAEHLETEKKTARNKGEARRKKFQAQDSVLNESLNASQAGSEASKLFNFIKFLF